MSKRGCETVYFTKHCIPKGQNIKPYYSISFAVELILSILLYTGVMFFMINSSSEFIPRSVVNINIAIVPASIVVAEVASFILNNSMIADITKKVKQAEKEKNQNLSDGSVNEG